MLLLRPHHINCLFFYRGLGYSDDFINSMNEISNSLRNNIDSKIRLIVKCDTLCFSCPNKKSDNTCITNEKVKKMDYDTLYAYNLKENKEYMFSQMIEEIYINFDKNKFYQVCNSCNWYKNKVCSESLISNQLLKWSLKKLK